MNVRRLFLFEAILARLSLGAIPVDGSYWFDPRKATAKSPPEDCARAAANGSPAAVRIAAPR